MPATFGLVCGAALLLGGATGACADEGVAFKNLMGSIGLIPQDRDPIRYRERAPLVIPPKTALPAPATSYASSNPQWPQDPDVVAKRKAADVQRSPVTWSETRRMSENNPRLTTEELSRGRSASTTAPIPGTHRGDNARDVLILSPDQMRASAKVNEDAPTPGAEPVRKILTDPPTGMRRAAAGKTVDTGYAPRVDQQALDANPMTWLTRKFSGGNEDE